MTPRDHELARRRCHIGQPVRFRRIEDEWLGALRIAVGARFVSGIHFDHVLGRNTDERLQTEIADAMSVFDKLELIARYWTNMKSFDRTTANTPPSMSYVF